MAARKTLRIGLISDTHGLLRPQAVHALEGAAHIVHAGDIGDPEILERLARVAPLTAVRGNNDNGTWAAAIPVEQTLAIGGLTLYVLHDIKELDLDPAAAGIDVVIAGHSHWPVISTGNGVLFVNPGSAGPRRFNLPVSVGLLDIAQGRAAAEIRMLDVSA
ncbi:MAG TPA: metallophosphoesterase family protein [Burkholderiaceae bacterium]|nr:metallophosphoesterase family protein [Burkholderiaceae bacterium]